MPRRSVQIRPIKLRKWFPPDDAMARAVAMLCVLREDLLLEFYGIANERIDRLDSNEAFYRRTYFWRNSFRTLVGVKRVLERLRAQGEFADALSRAPESLRQAFDDLNKNLAAVLADFAHNLRNNIGAHLREDAFRRALDTMEPDREGLFTIGDMVGNIHYRFAADLIWSVVLENVPSERHDAKAIEMIERTGGLTQAVAAIDDAVAIYLQERMPHRR